MAAERVAIVGGGFTGLVAARELIRARPDLEITLIERAPVLGGLAAGFPVCGTSLEQTYHYLFLTDSSILTLIRELGLEDRLIWGDSSVGVYLGGRVHPFTSPLDLLRYTPCSLMGRLRMGLAGFYLQRQRDWRGLLAHPARAWMKRFCGESAMRSVWDPLLKGKFDRFHDEVSMAWLWARIHTRMNSRAAGGEKLGYLRGGFAVITRKLEEQLRKAGAKIRVATTVERLEPAGGLVRLTIDGKTSTYDQCLFTGPSYALARALPATAEFAEYLSRLESIHYLGAICAIFVSDQSFAEQCWVNIHEAEAPFLIFIAHSKLVGTDLYQGKQVYYLGSYQPQDSPWFKLDESSLFEQWLGYLKRIYPQFDASLIRERHLFRFAAAQHVVDTRYEQKIPDHRTPVTGLYLANFSQIFPEDRGTNFAVRDGVDIARMMLEDLGRRSKGGSQ